MQRYKELSFNNKKSRFFKGIEVFFVFLIKNDDEKDDNKDLGSR